MNRLKLVMLVNGRAISFDNHIVTGPPLKQLLLFNTNLTLLTINKDCHLFWITLLFCCGFDIRKFNHSNFWALTAFASYHFNGIVYYFAAPYYKVGPLVVRK